MEPFLNLVWLSIGLVGSCHLLLQNFWKGWVLSGYFDSLWEAPVTLAQFGARDLCFSTFSLYQMAFHCQQMIFLLFMYWGLSLEVFILFILLDLHSLILEELTVKCLPSTPPTLSGGSQCYQLCVLELVFRKQINSPLTPALLTRAGQHPAYTLCF